MLKKIVTKNRTYRRFDNSYKVPMNLLRELIELARLSPSAGNLQPLKFIISNSPELNDKIFPTLAWAGYLKDWDGPADNERPSAYIIILGDKERAKEFCYDAGIAAQSITLGVAENGLGACMIGSIKRQKLASNLKISDKYKILLTIAIGKPAEKVVIEKVKDSIQYWRDKENVHHVPKRSLDDLILTA